MAKLLVTGATGQLGALVVEHLLTKVPADQVAVSVRDPQKAEALKARGVDVRFGDFNQPESLAAAFKGIDRLLIVSTSDVGNRVKQQIEAVKAAKQANVGFIAYTSAPRADTSKFALVDDHRATEEAIRATGIPYAFVRNNWYLENEIQTIQAVLHGAPWVTSAGDGKVGWATRKDYAEAAANVLAGEGRDNTVYELAGKPTTIAELAAILAEVSGKDAQVQQVDDATYASIMSGAGVPEPAIPFVVSIQQAIRDGSLDVESDDLPTLLGRPLTPLAVGLREIVSGLQG
ncbi:SDR family oxidoreductase [Cohnella suwonensis]|uniref:SDR family oxidoreductase n=1 Tax=Cohnella suwonensis TaxID=696072 RepID=A0ABW0LW87_9BACL